jgi:hypothetical protein
MWHRTNGGGDRRIEGGLVPYEYDPWEWAEWGRNAARSSQYAEFGRRDDDLYMDIRFEAGFRVQEMVARHERYATYDRPEGRLPGPHAVAWLYASPGQPGQVRSFMIDVASRMFPWTDDDRPAHNVKDSAVLVNQLVEIAQRNLMTTKADPLEWSDRRELLSSGAFFIGCAVSSLGRPGTNWANVRSDFFGHGGDMPAWLSVRLIDGTWVLGERNGRGWTTHSNRSMARPGTFTPNWRPALAADWMPARGTLEDALGHLVAYTDATYVERQHQRNRHRRATPAGRF